MARYENWMYGVALTLVVATLFMFGAPASDAFSWPDAPRHALNGAFVLDLVRDHPVHDPARYAYNYYSKYPALTILFYPPLFYFFLALIYSIFGVSQQSALIAEFICYVALAFGSYRLSRFWLSPTAAFGAALILIAAPETAYWGRQVMLEVPAFALLVWSAIFFIWYLHEGKHVSLYIAVALLVLAVYTKISSAFVGIVYLLVLINLRGTALLRDRNAYIVAIIAAFSLAPLVVLTLKFGHANIQSVSGIQDTRVSRASIAGWTWYARKIPFQIGVPALAAAIAGIVALGFRWKSAPLLSLPLLWLIVGYMFFSAIDLKEPRHTLFLLSPLSIFAAFGIVTWFEKWPRIAAAGVVALGLGTLALTLMTRPVLYVSGYEPLANFIARTAPRDSNIAFSGFRDGSFIFAMRTHEERRDLSTIRVDKLLLRIAVRRGLGVQDKGYSAAQIGQMLDRLGVYLVVAQPGFWVDLSSMREFEKLLHSRQFQPVARFAMQANYNAQEKELVVYRNLDPVARGPIKLDTEIPMIGRSVSGVLGSKD